MNLIGIVQGRISESPKNRLQFFPKNWRDEFSKVKKLNYDFIEFFSERKFNKNNPIWTQKGISEYSYYAKKYNLKIFNFCDDYIISNSFKEKHTINYLKKLIRNLNLLKVKNLILPFYGKSLLTDKNFLEYRKNLNYLENLSNNNVNFLIESNISPNTFNKLKKFFKNNKIKFLFDTGNRVNLNRDLYEDFEKFGSNIGHIHIKDKNTKFQNVPLNTGLVNFKKFFRIIKKCKYKKNFTFETTRSKNPYLTAKKNILFLKKFINKK